MSNVSVYSKTRKDWESFLIQENVSLNNLTFLTQGLYRDRSVWERHLSTKIRDHILNHFDFFLPEISSTLESGDGTVKFLLRLRDGLEIETVLIPFHKRFTVCLSTQVGCGMNCSFCYTGTQGYKRNLSSDEIVGQFIVARNWLIQKNKSSLTPSIVFMGQGEPLHNVDEVLQGIKILNDPLFIGIGHRQMTLSTVGYLPGLNRIKEFPKINFALSLHSPFDEERTQLIPINGRFPLNEVLRELDTIELLPRQFITYEYLLIKNFNMSDAHVEELHKLLKTRKAIVNLIPFNPYPGSQWQRPDTDEIETFKEKLVAKKLRVMVRTTKGPDILAACGQLKVNRLARKNGRNE